MRYFVPFLGILFISSSKCVGPSLENRPTALIHHAPSALEYFLKTNEHIGMLNTYIMNALITIGALLYNGISYMKRFLLRSLLRYSPEIFNNEQNYLFSLLSTVASNLRYRFSLRR